MPSQLGIGTARIDDSRAVWAVPEPVRIAGVTRADGGGAGALNSARQAFESLLGCRQVARRAYSVHQRLIVERQHRTHVAPLTTQDFDASRQRGN